MEAIEEDPGVPDEEADGYVVSDPELITQVRNGDRQAFGELYRRHSGPATTLARQFARNAAEADDLVSESFARVLDNLLDGKGPDSAFRAYLFTTIRNTAYDRTRKDKRLQFTDDMTTHDAPVPGDDPVLMKMESGLVASAFAQLPERWQAVLWHTQVEGESPAQVGALLGMAPGAVSSLAFRAREGLREAYLQAHLAETAAEQCRSTVERLGAWTRGGLSKRESQQVDAHLKTCDRCRALAAELQEVNHNLRGLLAPLLLGGAAAGYLATLGPVTPLAVPGALSAGAGGSAGSGSGGAGSGGATGAGSGTAGAAGAGGAGAAGGVGAAGVAAAAAAAAAGAAALGLGALAAASDSTAATGSAGSGAAGGSASGGAAAGGAAAAPAAAAAGGTAAGAGTAAGLSGLAASLGVGGLVAAGAVVAAAVIAAIVLIVSNNSPATTNTADQPPAVAAPVTSGGAGGSGGSDGTGASDGTGGGSATDPSGSGNGGAGPSSPIDAGAGTGPGSGDAGNGTTQTDAGTSNGGGSGAGDGSGNGAGGDGGGGNGVDGSVAPTATPTTSQPNNPGPGTGPAPANLSISDPVADELIAGGTASVTATVTNGGEQASGSGTMTIQTPAGVTVSSVEVSPQANGLRRAQAGLLRAGPCTAGSVGCTAQIPPINGGDSVRVTITLAAAPNATGGQFTVSVLGATKTFTVVASSIVGTTAGPLANDNLPRRIEVRATSPDAPGPLDFASSVPGVRFTATVECSTGEGSVQTITCRPDSDGRLVLSIVVDPLVGPGPLNVTATDGKGRTMALSGPDGQPLPIVASPARLSLSTPSEVTSPPAGGTGSFTLTAWNFGGTATTGRETIDLTFSQGVQLVRPTSDGVDCELTSTTADSQTWLCTLPVVDRGERLPLEFSVSALPSAIQGEVAAAITGRATGLIIAVPVNAGITGLTTATGELVADGTPSEVTVRAALAPTVTDPGKITFTSGSDDVRLSCGDTEAGRTTFCTPGDDGIFVLSVTVDKQQKDGNLPVTATAEGNRDLELVGPKGTVQIVHAPADLNLTLGTVIPPVAGGTGSITVTITNTGGVASGTDRSLALTLPNGVKAATTTSGVTCADTTCTLPPVPTDRPLTVVLDLTATPAATGGTDAAEIELGDRTTGKFDLTVGPGITQLRVDAGTLVADGTAQAVTVKAALADTVTEPGQITFDAPDGVTVTCAGGDSATCDLGPGNSVELTITLSTEAPRGPLALTATDEGSRPIVDTNFDGLVVAAPARLTFDGTPQIVKEPVAGGSGTFQVTVTNSGGVASTDGADVGVKLPDGLTLLRITCGRSDEVADLAAATAGCAVPPLKPGEKVTVEVAVHASPAAAGGIAVISLPTDSAGVALEVGPGLDRLTASMTGALVADGQPHEVTVTAIPVDGSVTEFGDVAFDSGSDQVDVTCGDTTGRRITCPFDGDGRRIMLTVTPGVAELTGFVTTDQRGRTIDNTFGQLDVLAPSSLTLSDLAVSPLTAGSGGTLTVTATNTGDVDTADGLDIRVVAQDLTGRELDPNPLRIIGASPENAVSCVGENCTLNPVAAKQPVALTFRLGAAATLPGDRIRVTIQVGQIAADPVETEVSSPITGVTVDPADDLYADGRATTHQVKVDSELSDPGPLTLSFDDAVTVTGTACRAGAVPGLLTCDGTAFDIAITVPIGTPAGSIALSASDAGGRSVPVTQLTIAKPANLKVVAVKNAPLTAGGQGSFEVLVRNTGDSPSLGDERVGITVPDGFTVTGMTIDGARCDAAATFAATGDGCALPSIGSGDDVWVTVDVSVEPGAPSEATAQVELPDQPAVPVTLAVQAGITGLEADPKATLPANDSAQPVTLTATVADGVRPGSVTVTSADPTVRVVCADKLTSCPVRDDHTVALQITVPETFAAKQLTLTATDASGERTIPVKPITVLGAPRLVAGDLMLNIRPVAGGQGQFSVTVRNDGASPYLGGDPIQVVDVSVPGSTIAGIDPGDGKPCSTRCVLPEISAGKSVTVVLTIAVPATTTAGFYDLGVNLVRQQHIQFEVAPAFSQVVASPPGPFPAGTSPTLTLTVGHSDESADPGPLTVTSDSPLVSVSGCGGQVSTLTCKGDTFTITVAIDATMGTGRLPVTITDVAGNKVPLTDGSRELQVSAPKMVLSPLTVVERYWGSTRNWPIRLPGVPAIDLTVAHLRLTATNPGSSAVGPTPIQVGVTNLVGPLVQTGPLLYCGAPLNIPCYLPRLGSGRTATVDIWVGLRPGESTGSVSVTADGSSQFAQVNAVQPPGAGTLTTSGTASAATPADPGGPAVTKSSALSETPTESVPEPGTEQRPSTGSSAPSTVSGSTDDPTEPTLPPAGSSEPGTTIPEAEPTRAPTSESSSVPSAGDPASESSTPTDEATEPTSSTPAPDPAHLVLGQAEVERPPAAGGSGAVTFTVRNDGGETSAGTAVKLTLPSGVSAASITVDGAHAGAGTSCTLPAIAPEESVTVTVTLAVDSDAQDGTARVDVPGDSARVDLTIDRPSPSSPSPTPTATSSSDRPAGRPEDAPAPAGDTVTASSAPAGS